MCRRCAEGRAHLRLDQAGCKVELAAAGLLIARELLIGCGVLSSESERMRCVPISERRRVNGCTTTGDEWW